MRSIILFWPTNSGKATQARKLFEYRSGYFIVVDVGTLLRDRSRVGDGLWDEIASVMQSGKFVPIPLVTELLKEQIVRAKREEKHCIFVFSRFVSEIAIFIGQSIGAENITFLHLHVSDPSILLKRAGQRRVFSGSERRMDDTEEVSFRRIEDFWRGSEHYLKNAREQGIVVHEIDAAQEEGLVFREIIRILRVSFF